MEESTKEQLDNDQIEQFERFPKIKLEIIQKLVQDQNIEILKQLGYNKEGHPDLRRQIQEDNEKLKNPNLTPIELEAIKKEKPIWRIFTKKGQGEIFNELQPIFYDRSGMFWLWNDDKLAWEVSDEVDILNIIQANTSEDIITSKRRSEIINTLKQEGRKNIPKPFKKTWIQFKDTIIDISNGERFDATPEYFTTNPIPYKINGDPNTPNIDRIFEQWVGKDYVKTLHEIIAYCLLADYPINRIFCFIGEGMNGKTCFLNLLRKFIGDKNVCSTELDTLMQSRFEVTRLHKKLVCMMGETNFNEMSKTSVLKKLSGGDFIGFEYKNKNPFEDYNYAKILIATNNLPTTTDKTIGFYRRWLIIDFFNRFTEKKDILCEIPEYEFENLATRCVLILRDLLESRQFTNEGSVEERMKKFEEKSNPLDKFIKEFCLTDDPSGFVTCAQFEKRFNEWCRENRFREFSAYTINHEIRKFGVDLGKGYIDWWENENKTRKQVRGYFGLKWKSL